MLKLRNLIFTLCVGFSVMACTSLSNETTQIQVQNKLDSPLKVTCSNPGGSDWLKPVTIKEGGDKVFKCGLEKRSDDLSYGPLTMQLKKGGVTHTISPRKESKSCKITVDYIEYNQANMKIVVSDLSKVDNVDVKCERLILHPVDSAHLQR